MDFRSRVLNPAGGLFLYGTTPPSRQTPPDKVDAIAEKTASRLSSLEADAIIVYDVQEEAGKNGQPRPFPYLPTLDSRLYAGLLARKTGKEAVPYKAVCYLPRDAFPDWLAETWEGGWKSLGLVGGDSSQRSYPGPSVSEAAETISRSQYPFLLGGVTIPERHARKRDEHRRIARKAGQGLRFFTSQIIYEPAHTLSLLKDYGALQETDPARIVLSFAPFGTEKTLSFLRWLGVEIPEETARRVLSHPHPAEESVRVCRESLERLLSSSPSLSLPLGISAESVSIYRNEIEASLELFLELKGVLERHSH